MVSGIMAGFVGGLGQIAAEEREAKREREARMEAIMQQRYNAMLPLVAKNLMATDQEAGKYVNSQKALMARLTDEEGNLIPGAETFMKNLDPRGAHELMKKIDAAEAEAASNDMALVLSGQDLLDRVTTFSSEKSGPQPMPNVSVQDLLEGNVPMEDMMRLAYTTSGTAAEPYVRLDPVRTPKSTTFADQREVFEGRVLQELQRTVLREGEVSPERFTRAQDLLESYKRDPDGTAMVLIMDEFGKEVYQDMLKEERFDLENDPYFKPYRTQENVVSEPVQATPTDQEREEAIQFLTSIIEDPNATQEEKDQARAALQDVIR